MPDDTEGMVVCVVVLGELFASALFEWLFFLFFFAYRRTSLKFRF